MNFFTSLLPSVSFPPALRVKAGNRIEIKSAPEIETMRAAAKIVATVLKEISEMTQAGMTTADLDDYAEKRIRALGATPSFKGYHGFPASICASINNEVVHGIPRKRKVIKSGDLVKIDTGAYYEGFHGDSCVTILVGKVKPEAKRLAEAAEEALYAGIAKVKPGNTLMDIAGAIEDSIKANKFTVVEDFTGHGVGRNLHEEPSVFNFRTNRAPDVTLQPGMALAIEPILNAGTKHTRTLSDRWTVVTLDRSLSAQWEHTVLVTETGHEILSDRTQL